MDVYFELKFGGFVTSFIKNCEIGDQYGSFNGEIIKCNDQVNLIIAITYHYRAEPMAGLIDVVIDKKETCKLICTDVKENYLYFEKLLDPLNSNKYDFTSEEIVKSFIDNGYKLYVTLGETAQFLIRNPKNRNL